LTGLRSCDDVKKNPNKDNSDLTIILNVWKGDNPKYLNDSILSVTKQTLTPNVLLIVSDGPLTDELRTLVKRYTNNFSWINFIETKFHQGVWAARNTALSFVNTKYVAIHDADDLMHPERISIQLDFMMKSDADILGTSMIEFDSGSNRILSIRNFGPGEITLGNFVNNNLNNSTLMAKYDVFKKIGNYKDIYCMEDYFFLLNALNQKVKVYNISTPLTAFRVTKDFYRRRRGIKFIKSEISIFSLRVTLGLPLSKEILILLARVLFRVLPPVVIRGLYWVFRQRSPYELTEGNLKAWSNFRLHNA
jgi:amylovoran biosynthesis glycosyltransferase AmsE